MRHSRGFTIIEMAVAFAIIGILAALAGPNLNKLNDRSKARSSAFDLASLFRLARSEALRTGTTHLLAINTGASATSAADDYVTLFANPGSTLDVSTLTATQLAGSAAPPGSMTFVKRLPLDSRVGLGPSTGFATTFTGAYASIPKSGVCSFCASGKGGIFFEADGKIYASSTTEPGDSAAPTGGTLVISHDRTWSGTTTHIYAVSFTKFGGVRVWEE